MPERQSVRPVLVVLVMCVLAAAPIARYQATPQTNPPIPKGRGFILGRTIDAGTSQPIAGAMVTLGPGQPGVPPGGRAGASPAGASTHSVVTNADGYFLFSDLAGGRYAIKAAAFGYIDAGYLQSKPTDPPHALDLADDEKHGGADIRMWKYGAIGGTVTDEAGVPVVGAAVRLLRRGVPPRPGVLVPVAGAARTDDRGQYRFGGLEPADYVVGIFTMWSTIPAALADAYAAAAAAAPDPARAPAMSGELRNNGVVSPSGTGVRVGDLILQLPNSLIAPPQPVGDGRVAAYAATIFRDATSLVEATPIALGSGEERTGVDLSMRLVPTVRVSGVLLGPDGPAKNIGVNLYVPGNERASVDGLPTATAVTDTAGAFTMFGVPPGSYILKAARSMIVRTAAPRSACSTEIGWAGQHRADVGHHRPE